MRIIEILKSIAAFVLVVPAMMLMLLFALYVAARTSLTGERWNEGRGFYRD